jgi:hypothetical protein
MQASGVQAIQNTNYVRRFTTIQLERTRRELKANLGLITPGSPAHVPIRSYLQAIDAELAERASHQQAGEAPVMNTETELMSCDPLTALSNEYEAEWNMRYPGKYVADHHRLDGALPGRNQDFGETSLPGAPLLSQQGRELFTVLRG